jgi:pimeloyl-ACP methyl ester carboxylesterase
LPSAKSDASHVLLHDATGSAYHGLLGGHPCLCDERPVFGTGLATIAWRLRERGYIVMYGSYRQDRAFAADAGAHPADRIVVIGHSFGAEAAARVATQAAACGTRDVTMIGVDPAAPSEVRGVSHAINFVGEYRGTIAGAQNIPVAGYTHMGIMESPAMQERILSEVSQ